jgi:hypothetical protein
MRVIGKNLFDVLSPIEYTYDLWLILVQSIKYDLRRSSERTQTRPNVVARTSSKRKAMNSRNQLGDLADYLVRSHRPYRASIVIPKVVNIVERSGDQRIGGLRPAML